MSTKVLPRPFLWRRLHSLFGLWLVLFLMEHLLTNSQAALLLGENARGFIHFVQALHNIPYLQVIEILLLGVPILFHMVWGIKYALQAKTNSGSTDGAKPSLKEYGRNRAYTWQRITSWILLLGLILHVVKFRFLEYPKHCFADGQPHYFVKVGLDRGLYTVAARLHVKLYDQKAIEQAANLLQNQEKRENYENIRKELLQQEYTIQGPVNQNYDARLDSMLTSAQSYKQKAAWLATLSSFSLKKPSEIVAETADFGTATLLTVRDTFKSPIYVAIYTVFVLAAVFHAFNGLWTFLITWGLLLNYRSQKKTVAFCFGLMLIIGFLGLAAVWGTYWLNLRT